MDDDNYYPWIEDPDPPSVDMTPAESAAAAAAIARMFPELVRIPVDPV
jgi:hypothetical protein